jgi:hypothetical protein
MQCSGHEALKTLSVESGESLDALLHSLRQQQEAIPSWQETGGHLRNGSLITLRPRGKLLMTIHRHGG